MIVESRGTPIHFVDEGAGTPVVLVHGVGADLTSWDAIAATLAERRRVIRLDLRGHGQSGRIEHGTLDDLFGDVEAVIEATGAAPVHLVGFSLGGLIAQGIALKSPAKLHSVVILSAVAGRTEAERKRVAERAVIVREQGIAAITQAADQRWFTDEFRRKHPEKVARRLEQLKANHLPSYVAAYTVFGEGDLGARLHEIRVPALIATGEHDVGSNTRMARFMHERIAGSELVILPGLRHSILLEAPEQVTALIEDFLDRQDK
jgi:pimeloyl-ACP methyl ester carboxylesterase